MEATQWICKHCGNVFTTRGKYQSHYRREHQQEVKNKTSEGDTKVARAANSLFVCECGKEYQLPQSLTKHKQKCDR